MRGAVGGKPVPAARNLTEVKEAGTGVHYTPELAGTSEHKDWEAQGTVSVMEAGRRTAMETKRRACRARQAQETVLGMMVVGRTTLVKAKDTDLHSGVGQTPSRQVGDHWRHRCRTRFPKPDRNGGYPPKPEHAEEE